MSSHTRKSQEERQQEVDRQLEAMRVAIGDDNWDSDSDSDDSDDSEMLQARGRSSAMESARKFLWDEVDDEDDHLYLGGPFPTKPATPPRRASISTSSRSHRARNSSGADMFRPSVWDSQRIGLDDSINLMDASDRESLAGSLASPKHPGRRTFSDMFLRGGKKAPTKAANTPWYDAEARDADDYLDRTVKKKKTAWSYLGFLFNLVLWIVLLGLFYVFGWAIWDFVKDKLPQKTAEVDVSELVKHTSAITKALAKHGILEEAALEDPNSPQAKALEWLVQDTMEPRIKAHNPFIPQRYSLAVTYLALHGEEWENSDGWMTKEGYCSWHGVSCLGTDEDIQHHHGNGKVFELNLSSNQVKGEIPVELNGLEDLFFLDLQDNQLDGTIPENLGNWTGLRMLSLAHNELYGSIPVKLVTTAPDLHVLNAGHNGLTGTIPPELGDATNLREIRLEFNGLYGHIPNSLRRMDRLETLHLAGNKLGGSLPDGIFDMARLETLYLHDNSLTGHLSHNFAKLTHLELVTLDNNQLMGTVPNVFSEIKFLQEIHFHANQFTGTMPHSICSLQSKNKLTYVSATCSTTEDKNAMGIHCDCCTACK